MIRLNVKFNGKDENINIEDDYLFNAYLIEHPTLIKKLIHSVSRLYNIEENYFNIVNGYIDCSTKNNLYPGLIVRVNIKTYAVLYLDTSNVSDDYMIDLISEYIYDKGDITPDEINIDKFEITRDTFLDITN